jgi:ABC-type cobalamin/Fe3+-siderophores transport system ATPase subunit
MPFSFSIPQSSPNGPLPVNIEPGSSIIFVGANGGGKTRLAVHIENSLKAAAHRISAHRALILNPTVPKIDEKSALRGLKFGNVVESAGEGFRLGHRWQSKEAVSLLNDFDYLVQALFAEQSNKSLETHKKNRSGDHSEAEPTRFEKLTAIWERLLPHRKLHVTGDDIEVSPSNSSKTYKASEMSDGERAIFYMIGQVLVADLSSLLIIDEPELHVHRSIMGKLWDELEAARPDCGFAFITHDLEFAAARVAQKFIIRDYTPVPDWIIEVVPEDTGFSEEITTLILGSRRPILFVEGDQTSLDMAVYRCCYPDWTVVPRGSCEEVIHSVVTMRRNQAFTRVTCAGMVDADDYSTDDIAYLESLGIKALPVSEIENVFLLPSVSKAIAEIEGYSGSELETRLIKLRNAIFASLNSAKSIDDVVVRYCRRRIDRTLKKIDFSAADTVDKIASEYSRKTADLDIPDIAAGARTRIENAITSGDLPALLANYDNKGMMNLAATHLKSSKKDQFEAWLVRALRSGKQPTLTAAIKTYLPTIIPE